MAGQICETCKHKHNAECYCSPNSICFEYEEEDLVVKDKETMEEAIIRASNKAIISSHQLLDVFMQQGVTGVYNLGMKHMWEYLEDK